MTGASGIMTSLSRIAYTGETVEKLIKRVALAIFLLTQISVSALAQEKGRDVTLVVGEVQILPMPSGLKITRIGIGNGKLFNATVLEKEGGIVLIPEMPGRTNMVIWGENGKTFEHAVAVYPTNIEMSVNIINSMLKGIENVKAERVGDTILVTGITSKDNMPRVDMISKSFPLTMNMVRREELELKRMIYMRVQIVEMKKSLTENIGVKWDQSVQGPAVGVMAQLNTGPRPVRFFPGITPSGLPGAGQETTPPPGGFGWRPVLGLTSIITSAINLGVSNGDAYVLASPELSTRSGGKAEFLAGGQIPVVSPSSGTTPATVTFKDYGIKLSIEPVADDKGNVSTTIDTEISTVDSSNAVANNPGFLTRKTKTEVNVREGQTIVISGLVNTELAKDVSKLAGLGNIPVLGALFRSNNFRTGRTDLVILVTPTVIDPSPEGVKKALEIQESAKKFAGNEGFLLK